MIPGIHRRLVWTGILTFHLVGACAEPTGPSVSTNDAPALSATNDIARALLLDDEASGPRVYVSPISNDHLVKRAELLREEHLREAIIFLFQYRGVAVARLNADPKMTPEFGLFPPEWTWSLVESSDRQPGQTKAAIHIQNDTALRVLSRTFSGGGKLARDASAEEILALLKGENTPKKNDDDSNVHEKATPSPETNKKSGNLPEPRQIVVDPGTRDFIPIAVQVASQIGFSIKTNIPSDVPVPVPDAVTNRDRLDWSFGQRLKRINELLDKVSSEAAGAADFGELAALFTLHGAYYGRCNEPLCYRYFGRARVFAELADRSGSPWARQLREEIELLTLRFGAGRLFQLAREPLLPETATLFAFESRTLAEAEHYPRIDNLFDFLVRCDSVSVARGQKEAVRDFMAGAADKYPFDAALVWSLPTARNSYEFDAAMFMLNDIVGCLQQQVKDSLESISTNWGAFDQRFKDSLGQTLRDPTNTLQSSGAHFQGRWGRLSEEVKALLPLVGFVRICDQMSSSKEMDARSDMCLDLQATVSEFRDRIMNMLLLIRVRFSNLGWGLQRDDMDFIVASCIREELAAPQFYEVAPEFTREDIIAPASLVAALKGADNSRFPDPATRLLGYFTAVQKSEILGPAGGSPSQESVLALLAALNAALDDRAFYDQELFASLPMADSLRETLAGGMADSSLTEVRSENRKLLEIVFYPWLATRDHSQPAMVPLGAEMWSAFAAAGRQYYHCDFAGAVQTMTPWLPAFGSDTGDSPKWGLLCDAMQRDGRVEETFPWIGRLEAFALEQYRFYLLKWERDKFPGVSDSVFDELTDSYRDYVSRAEYALRKRDFATMLAVTQKYHYTPDAYQTVLSELSEIMTGGRDDTGQWQRFESAHLSF